MRFLLPFFVCLVCLNGCGPSNPRNEKPSVSDVKPQVPQAVVPQEAPPNEVSNQNPLPSEKPSSLTLDEKLRDANSELTKAEKEYSELEAEVTTSLRADPEY